MARIRSTHTWISFGHRWRILGLVAVLIGLLPAFGATGPGPVQPSEAAPSAQAVETPREAIDGQVTAFTGAGSKLYFLNDATCLVGGPAPETEPTVISRVASTGSRARDVLYENTPRPVGICNSYRVLSNLAADDDFLYFVDVHGLVKLSVLANPGDPPILLSSVVTTAVSGPRAEVVIDSGHVSLLTTDPAGGKRIERVAKSGSSLTPIATPPIASGLATDGEFLYWVEPTGVVRYRLSDSQTSTFLPGAVAVYPEGGAERLAFIARSDQVIRLSNGDNSTAVIYTSATPGAAVYAISGNGTALYALERRPVSCPTPPCTPPFTNVVIRLDRTPGSTATLLHTVPAPIGSNPIPTILPFDNFVFWHEEGLPGPKVNSLGTIPVPVRNLRITGIEVTQGIQDLDNSINLIIGRRTYVRLYVKSDVCCEVPGVSARLEGTWLNGEKKLPTLYPINTLGGKLTVPYSPAREIPEMSFLFELPDNFLEDYSLIRFRGVLNPNKWPPEPTYADNVYTTTRAFTGNTSGVLAANFVNWGFSVDGKTYSARLKEDIQLTEHYILDTYPLASSIGGSDSFAAFRRDRWYVFDDSLGARIERTHPDCLKIAKEDRNLCASAYTNAQMAAMRDDAGISENRFFYGYLNDDVKFPRGQACCGTRVSSGPAGDPKGTAFAWDTDSSYGDWYAAHEIGHTIGRDHPVKGSVTCGHSAVDPNFPHPVARIGPGTLSFMGWRPAASFFNLKHAVYADSIWRDFMSYCDYQWISDYTYRAMFQTMTKDVLVSATPASSRVTGDLLALYGDVAADGSNANLYRVQRQGSVGTIPLRQPGPYSIQLVDGQGAILANFPFQPQDAHEGVAPRTPFGQVVPFSPGTSVVRIVRNADGRVLESRAVSASDPILGPPGIVPAPGSTPVAGTVELRWTGSDLDGDSLHYDVDYSPDGGATFQPIARQTLSTTLPVSTTLLPGSNNALLRVTASDGVRTATATTAPFAVAKKPPTVVVLDPESGREITYGTTIGFGALIEDLDGTVPASNIAWRNQKGLIGVGSHIVTDTLPVGINVITVTALSTSGLSASQTITVIVNDDLRLPGPRLVAGPSQIGWHVDPATTEIQTGQITIGNIGGGTLSVTVTISPTADWLTVDPITGTLPYSLTVRANPGGQPAGTSRSTVIRISANPSGGGPAQVVEIPVTLSVGDILGSIDRRSDVTVPGSCVAAPRCGG